MGWGTAQKFYSYNRKCQSWVGWEQTASTDTQAAIKVSGCARSGDGSGYYYAYDFGVTVKIFYRVDGGEWNELKSTTTVLNYGAEVGNISASFTINRTHKTQVVEVACDAISTTGDWSTATAKMSISVNPKTSYAITFNANKPSAASANVQDMPADQTKWYDEALTLPGTSPTLNLYNFKGWNTKADGSGTAYEAEATYSGNAALTLYAQWELAYAYPTIDPATVIRCDSSGTEKDDGTYGKASFTWSIDATADDGANVGKRAVISWKQTTTANWDNASSVTITLSGTGGTINRVFGSGAISTDVSYDVRIAVTDTHTINDNECTAYRYLMLSQAFFTMDFLAGGHGVAMGIPATQEDTFELAMDFNHHGSVVLDAASKAAWLSALGLGEVTATPTYSSWNNYWSFVKKKYGVVTATFQGQIKTQVTAWSSFSVILASLPEGFRPTDYFNFTAIAQINGSLTPAFMQVAPNDGSIRVRTAGTAIPANTWMWFGFSYFAAG